MHIPHIAKFIGIALTAILTFVPWQIGHAEAENRYIVKFNFQNNTSHPIQLLPVPVVNNCASWHVGSEINLKKNSAWNPIQANIVTCIPMGEPGIRFGVLVGKKHTTANPVVGIVTIACNLGMGGCWTKTSNFPISINPWTKICFKDHNTASPYTYSFYQQGCE